MGLPGKPTFMDVRTSIATHARNTHSKADREKVSKFMCHDTSTADRFYAMNLNVRQAVEHRRLFEGALVGEEVSPAKPAAEEEGQGKRKRKTKHGRGAPKRRRDESPPSSPPTSSPEEESEAVPFQESGVSSLDSPPSLEKYPGEKEESPDSSSSSSVGASPVRTPSELSAPSAEPASPAVHDPEQADPEQADPGQAEPEQAAPPLGLLSRPKRAAKRPVVVLTPVKPTLSPLSRNKICRVSGVARASRARANLRRALDKARKNMAPVKCPFCHKPRANMRQHLRVSHGILNLRERHLWVSFSLRKVTEPFRPCPLCGRSVKYIRPHFANSHKDLSLVNLYEPVLNTFRLLGQGAQEDCPAFPVGDHHGEAP
ncbi:uncharacterized protein [Misgurnus anguillicaudatus]|uniref:uncharacterized protein n=1 Tax=Misgurnus anguillicaudatus TaxID=75329 RepID=UPI003CCFA63B